MSVISDELLTSFCQHGHPLYGGILTAYSYKGDLTQSGDERARRAMGDEAFVHRDWNTLVCNGRILIDIESYKHPKGVEGSIRFPTQWFWCLSQVRANQDCTPATADQISRVEVDLQEDLKRLPKLEYVSVLGVNSWSYGRGKPKRKRQQPPNGIVFFRFTGGAGLVITKDYTAEVRS
jgi:hypothetical protein